MKLTIEEATWLACAIDGEGCISLLSAKRRDKTQVVMSPIVSVANCHRGFVTRAYKLMRWACGTGHIAKGHAGANHPVLKAEIGGQKSCKLLLTQVLPWLIIKAKRAEALLKWIEDRKLLRKHRPKMGGGTPYGEETVRALLVLRASVLTKETR